jgi:hypothetical protein
MKSTFFADFEGDQLGSTDSDEVIVLFDRDAHLADQQR